ncbi:Hypothetical protein, putative [Bodo saltans]|uniref:Uncharacterized protein n=1 Tax=Bodo saltans TaxID=75058 RepID=A0A0S4JAA9_BODSA|nr:Hypothetical protein, putative [Bodo saltans]|eukprot:CUG87051.1 Hypothetical protein, putative [Bodo saltans]
MDVSLMKSAESSTSSRVTTPPVQPRPGIQAPGGGVSLVAAPMELRWSRAGWINVHPLLFYRHCFRLTSQNDRVPRVLVMSEHYISYLCAPDGRATWSFHPSTVKSVHIMPTRDQALFTFRYHSTDLLLHFDDKLAADRINPPMATLSLIIFLLCREALDIVVKEEDDLTALRRSNLIKSSDQKGAEGFVRRLVDGLRGYYVLLQAQIEDVKEELEMYHADHHRSSMLLLGDEAMKTQHDLLVAADDDPLDAEGGGGGVGITTRMLLAAQRRRSASLAALKLHPLQVRSLHTVSNPVGYLHQRTSGMLGMKNHKNFCVIVEGELPLPQSAFRGLIVFYRRGVTVTTDVAAAAITPTTSSRQQQQRPFPTSAGGIFTPEVVDRIGILEDNNELRQKSQRLPLLHSSSRVGDIFVDTFGFVYFLPQRDHKQQQARHKQPPTLSQAARVEQQQQQPPSSSHDRSADVEVVAFLPTVVEHSRFPHETIRERVLRRNQRLNQTPSYARLSAARSTAMKMNEELVKRLQTGSWAAVTLAPTDSIIQRRQHEQLQSLRTQHMTAANYDDVVEEYADDGGEALMNSSNSQAAHLREQYLAEASSSSPAAAAAPSQHNSLHLAGGGRGYLNGLKGMKHLDELSSILHRSENNTITTTSQSANGVTGGAALAGSGASFSSVGILETSSLAKKAAEYSQGVYRAQQGGSYSNSKDMLSTWSRIVTVLDFDAASASKMTPTDSVVAAVDVLVDLCDTLTFSAIKEFSTASTLSASSGEKESTYQKTLTSSEDHREARRRERGDVRQQRSTKRAAHASVETFDEIEAFIDSRATLGDMLHDYGAPWRTGGGGGRKIPTDLKPGNNSNISNNISNNSRRYSTLSSSSNPHDFSSFAIDIDNELLLSNRTQQLLAADRQQRALEKVIALCCDNSRFGVL